MTKSNHAISSSSPYNGSLTREQFLFYEIRTTAKLKAKGLSDTETIETIAKDNLFQFPTEKTIRNLSQVCIRRLNALDDPLLVQGIADKPSEEAKQICLYAMMKSNRLVWDFMVTVIGEKYRTRNYSFGKIDMNVFMMRLAEQDDLVASWAESTVQKIKSVLVRTLIENEYLDGLKADHLNPVWLYSDLENAIRAHNDDIILPAFNCLG